VASAPDCFAYIVLLSESKVDGVDEAGQEEIGLMTSKINYSRLKRSSDDRNLMLEGLCKSTVPSICTVKQRRIHVGMRTIKCTVFPFINMF